MPRTANTQLKDNMAYKNNFAKDRYIKMFEIDERSVRWEDVANYINWKGTTERCPAFAMLLDYYMDKYKVSVSEYEEKHKNDKDIAIAHRTFYSMKKGEAVPKPIQAKALLEYVGAAANKMGEEIICLSNSTLDEILTESKKYVESLSTIKYNERATLCLDFSDEEKKIKGSKTINPELMKLFSENDESILNIVDKIALERYGGEPSKKTGEIKPNRNLFFKEVTLYYLGFIKELSKVEQNFDNQNK